MEEDLNTILHRQQIFCSALKSYFVRKVTKYQNILLKNCIQLSDQGCEDNFDSLPSNQSFEEHIELVIGQKTASPNFYKTFLKIGNRISTLKLFRWIYLIVQRTKAARVLHHLDGVADDEVKAVINSVGEEISVAFEYQLCLLDGESEIVKLAQHAGACIITYLNSKEAEYNPENLIQAVLEVKPKSSNNKEILKTRTICFNNHPVCLRWKLGQVFKQPGLRTTLGEEDKGVQQKPSSAAKSDESADDGAENVNGNTSDITELQQSVETAHSLDVDQTTKVELDTTEGGESNSNASDGDTDSQTQALCIKTSPNRTKVRRRITEIDMDYEKDVMIVTERSVEASDFSSIGNNTVDIEGGDSTSIEEDLNSEKDSADNFTEIITRIGATSPHKSPQESTKDTNEDFPKNLDNLHNVCTTHPVQLNESTKDINEDFPKNLDNLDNVCIIHPVQLNEKTNNIVLIAHGHSMNDTIDNKDDSNINISEETPQPEHDTCCTSANLPDVKSIQVEKDVYDQQTSDSERDLHGPNSVHPNNDIHISSSDNTKSDTYQDDTNISSIVSDISMPDTAAACKSYVFYGCFTPYGAKCRPKIYGYRGPLHIWNEEQRKHSLIYNDTVTLARKRPHDSNNHQLIFHQRYIPKTVCKH